jgi:2-keto-3-deoxy-L-rhamnonate aldolase RhmA
MTQDEIIAMARQVGYPIQHPEWQKATEEFAALVAAKEREECAKVCEKTITSQRSAWGANFCIAAIRARGEQA